MGILWQARNGVGAGIGGAHGQGEAKQDRQADGDVHVSSFTAKYERIGEWRIIRRLKK